MSKSLPIVPYEKDRHEAALAQLADRVLGPQAGARRKSVLDSFHRSMPGRDRAPLRHIVLDGERAAGTLGYMPADFLVSGARVPVRYTHDLFVDPAYALVGHRTLGKGLGAVLVEHARELGGFIPGGMWMTNSCYRIHLASGFDDAGRLTTYTSVLDPAGFCRRKGIVALKGAVSRAGFGVARAVALAQARRRLARDGASVQTVDRFDAALDPAWLDLAKSYAVTRVRDAEYLNWKYVDHPTLDYRAVLVSRAGRPRGYAIWRPAPAGAVETRAVIADFLVEKGDAGTLRLLAARVLLDAAGLGIDAVAVLTTQAWAAGALRTLGFVPSRTRNAWVIAGWRGLIPPEWLCTHEPWHVCLGDSDGDIWTGTM
jgi:hypothetical protein